MLYLSPDLTFFAKFIDIQLLLTGQQINQDIQLALTTVKEGLTYKGSYKGTSGKNR